MTTDNAPHAKWGQVLISLIGNLSSLLRFFGLSLSRQAAFAFLFFSARNLRSGSRRQYALLDLGDFSDSLIAQCLCRARRSVQTVFGGSQIKYFFCRSANFSAFSL